MKELTEYERDIFFNLENVIGDDKWYTIKPTRLDRDRFISAIKKRIDMHGDFEFNEDYSKFRKIEPFNPNNYSGISIKLEFNDHLVQLPYDHLPEPKYTEENKKVKRRAV